MTHSLVVYYWLYKNMEVRCQLIRLVPVSVGVHPCCVC